MKATAFVLAVLMSTNAVADMKHVPPWTMTGGKACYEFQEAKKLVQIDSDLTACLAKDIEWAELVKNLQTASAQLQVALTAEKSAGATLKANSDHLAAELMKETERANKAEAKPGMFPAWAIGAGVGLVVGVIAGILLGVYVSK